MHCLLMFFFVCVCVNFSITWMNKLFIAEFKIKGIKFNHIPLGETGWCSLKYIFYQSISRLEIIY